MAPAGSPDTTPRGPCPQCGTDTRLDTANPWRPFCSERCKLLDLGEWFSGGYRVPASPDDNDSGQDDGTLQ